MIRLAQIHNLVSLHSGQRTLLTYHMQHINIVRHAKTTKTEGKGREIHKNHDSYSFLLKSTVRVRSLKLLGPVENRKSPSKIWKIWCHSCTLSDFTVKCQDYGSTC